MTSVADTYHTICEDELYTRAEKSEYWASVHKFWEEVKNRHVGQLSLKQMAWLDKIEKQLGEDN